MHNQYNSLYQNFLFQASLGSKELFHSNMLAWILEQQNKEGEFEAFRLFVKEIAQIEIPKIYNREEIRIEREEKNIDLILKWRDGGTFNYIFIENKIKSIPSVDQLTKYDKTINKYTTGKIKLFDGVEFISLVRSKKAYRYILTPLSSNIEHGDWINITYENDILKFLSSLKNIEFQDQESSNIHLVIQTYIEFLGHLILLLNEFQLSQEDSVAFSNRAYDFYSSSKMHEIRKMRLHDLILKLAHYRIGNLLQSTFIENDIHVRRIDTDFSNSTGMTTVDMEISSGSGFYIGVQLQANQVRYYISSANKKLNEKFAVKIFQSKLWFCDILSLEPLLGKGDRRTLYKELGMHDESGARAFCEYNKGEFIYLYKNLFPKNDNDQKEYTINDVVELFLKSFQFFLKNKTKFEEQLKSLQ